MQTHNNLKWVVLALHQYHDKYRCFPPAVVYDDKGVSQHSWRALIQPQLVSIVPTGDDFLAYNFSQSWNSSANINATEPPSFGYHSYQCLAIVGPHAAWDRNKTRRIRNFTDGTSKTILVIAIPKCDIKWHEPRDIVFDGKKFTLDGKELDHSQDVYIIYGDGRVEYFADGISKDDLLMWTTIDLGDIPSP